MNPRSHRKPQARWPGFALAAFAVLAAGCGLAEYDARARRTHERLQKHDAEDALLGEPIHLPQAAVPFYLRLPREVSPHPAPSSGVQGLARFPCQAAPDRLAILEVYAGFVTDVQVPDILLDRVLHDLQIGSGDALEPIRDEPQELEVRREWESPQLLQANEPVRYRRWVWSTRREVPRNPQGQSLPLPAGFTAGYRYEIYLRSIGSGEETEPTEGHVVIIFRQLDVEATRKRWEQLLASRTEDSDSQPPSQPSQPDAPREPSSRPPGGTDSPIQKDTAPATPSSSLSPSATPAAKSPPTNDVLRWLPTFDKERLEQAKRLSLASLRLGEAARQRLQCWGR